LTKSWAFHEIHGNVEKALDFASTVHIWNPLCLTEFFQNPFFFSKGLAGKTGSKKLDRLNTI